MEEGICCYCGRHESLTREHIMPKSKGGPDHDLNIRMACSPCNLSRGNRPIEVWRKSIARKVAGVPDFGRPQRAWVTEALGRDPYDVDTSGVVFAFEGGASDWREKLAQKK